VSREHPLAPHRLVPIMVVLSLAATALLFVRGPEWYQRFYHPLTEASAIAENSRAQRLDPYLVAALINVESGFRADVVSSAGAVGLMQVLPETGAQVARDSGLQERVTAETLKRPGTNLRVGTRHLRALFDAYREPDVALAAYNAGSVAVDRWLREAAHSGRPVRDIIDFPATRYYVDEVLGQRETYKELYPEAFAEAK
jgi:soluble lytic murein transglycosylase